MGVKDGDKYFVGSQRLMERENVALNNTKYNIYVSKIMNTMVPLRQKIQLSLIVARLLQI